MNTIVHVNRSIQIGYPTFMKEVMHRDLQALGPATYDLAQLELYLSPTQRQSIEKGGSGWMTGPQFHEHLKEARLLETCLGIHDALAIKSKGVRCFSRLFGAKTLCFWKSTGFHEDGLLYVPTVGISTKGNMQRLFLNWNQFGCNSEFPAARFRSDMFLRN